MKIYKSDVWNARGKRLVWRGPEGVLASLCSMWSVPVAGDGGGRRGRAWNASWEALRVCWAGLGWAWSEGGLC